MRTPRKVTHRYMAGAYMLRKIPVGSKVWFEGEKQGYTVRASNVAFCICTKPMNALHTVLYSVIDWENDIRGTENLVFGMGAETDEQCAEMLNRLTEGESEVSHRNNVRLKIVKFKHEGKCFEQPTERAVA